MRRKSLTIRLEPGKWKALKMRLVDDGETFQTTVERYIDQYLVSGNEGSMIPPPAGPHASPGRRPGRIELSEGEIVEAEEPMRRVAASTSPSESSGLDASSYHSSQPAAECNHRVPVAWCIHCQRRTKGNL